VVVESLP
jgi:hypothetical protein